MTSAKLEGFVCYRDIMPRTTTSRSPKKSDTTTGAQSFALAQNIQGKSGSRGGLVSHRNSNPHRCFLGPWSAVVWCMSGDMATYGRFMGKESALHVIAQCYEAILQEHL
eukprot:2764218-Amphidinium_carterae.1